MIKDEELTQELNSFFNEFLFDGDDFNSEED
ncbi:hypothetical protein SAMN05421877_102206 [Sphingobacterium lactis]|uniref:Uncharacterized protein n=1 Tax=Sphingobacterium lactis TaxID=797291 RepID=A0A1H5U7T6_9SPHI|nr:hypothetical protein SAMN05421877_102206 [Sphingobacterium lactis]